MSVAGEFEAENPKSEPEIEKRLAHFAKICKEATTIGHDLHNTIDC